MSKPEKCQGCDRGPWLDAPFCCVPCEVTSQVGVNNGHSVTCNEMARAAAQKAS